MMSEYDSFWHGLGEIFMYIYPNMNMRIGCFVRSSLIHSRISRDTAAKIVIIRQIVSVIYQACTRGVLTAKEGVCLRYSGLFFFSGFYRGWVRLLSVVGSPQLPNPNIRVCGTAVTYSLFSRILFLPFSPHPTRVSENFTFLFTSYFSKYSRTGLIRIRGISRD